MTFSQNFEIQLEIKNSLRLYMYGSVEYLYSLHMIVVFQLYQRNISVSHCRCFVLHEDFFFNVRKYFRPTNDLSLFTNLSGFLLFTNSKCHFKRMMTPNFFWLRLRSNIFHLYHNHGNYYTKFYKYLYLNWIL